MSARHSQSLLLVWRVAEIEARNANASEIDLTHLWLGLCKVVDIDLPSAVSRRAPDREEVLEELLREIKRLRRVFRAGAMDACAFRRKLRAKAAERGFSILESTQSCDGPTKREGPLLTPSRWRRCPAQRSTRFTCSAPFWLSRTRRGIV